MADKIKIIFNSAFSFQHLMVSCDDKILYWQNTKCGCSIQVSVTDLKMIKMKIWMFDIDIKI